MTTVSTRLAQPDFKTSKKNNEEKMPEESREGKTATGKPKAVANHHPCLRFQMESIEGRDKRTNPRPRIVKFKRSVHPISRKSLPNHCPCPSQ